MIAGYQAANGAKVDTALTDEEFDDLARLVDR
jgi:hypothetical protein